MKQKYGDGCCYQLDQFCLLVTSFLLSFQSFFLLLIIQSSLPSKMTGTTAS